MEPLIFLFTYFCPKVDPLKTCSAKSDKQKKTRIFTFHTCFNTQRQFIKLTTHGCVFITAYHKFICFEYAKCKWLILYFWQLAWICAPWKWWPRHVSPLFSPWLRHCSVHFTDDLSWQQPEPWNCVLVLIIGSTKDNLRHPWSVTDTTPFTGVFLTRMCASLTINVLCEWLFQLYFFAKVPIILCL